MNRQKDTNAEKLLLLFRTGHVQNTLTKGCRTRTGQGKCSLKPSLSPRSSPESECAGMAAAAANGAVELLLKKRIKRILQKTTGLTAGEEERQVPVALVPDPQRNGRSRNRGVLI